MYLLALAGDSIALTIIECILLRRHCIFGSDVLIEY